MDHGPGMVGCSVFEVFFGGHRGRLMVRIRMCEIEKSRNGVGVSFKEWVNGALAR